VGQLSIKHVVITCQKTKFQGCTDLLSLLHVYENYSTIRHGPRVKDSLNSILSSLRTTKA